MFTIIGADQKQYGPVSADEIRQWILEGRADGRTVAQSEGTTEWKPLASFPEFADVFAPAQPAAPARPATMAEIFARDYDVDISGCVSRAWNLAVKNFWPVIGITAVVMIAVSVVNQIVGLICMPSMQTNQPPPTTFSIKAMVDYMQLTPLKVALIGLSGLIAAPFQFVLFGGLYKYYINLIRGERAGMAEAFSGFTEAFSQLAILGFVTNLVVLIGTALCFLPGIYLMIALIFSVPLVMDKGLTWQEAMKTSMTMVNKHWFVIFGMVLVAGLVAMAGFLACCLPYLFTLPVSLIAMMFAYETIFGGQAR